jgi:14-3-3 protein epsilon
MSVDYEKLLYQAKLANSAGRHQKTFSLMETIVRSKKDDLTSEERNLFAISYKHIIAAARASLNKINELYEQEKEKEDGVSVHLISKMKESLSKELKDACDLMIELLDKILIPNAKTADSKVFFNKLRGDYYRYLAIFFNANEYTENSLVAYKQATQFADVLSCINPIKIDLALSFSVFYYDILKKPEDAISIASEALNEGLDKIGEVDEADLKEVTASLQLLKDNVDYWSKDIKTEDEIDDI